MDGGCTHYLGKERKNSKLRRVEGEYERNRLSFGTPEEKVYAREIRVIAIRERKLNARTEESRGTERTMERKDKDTSAELGSEENRKRGLSQSMH